ncbi:MAG: hypothetical protein ACJ73S_09405 [Mycobacteriales bacterium]
MTRTNRGLAAVVGLAVLVAAGCSSSPSSPKAKLIRTGDAKCRTINKRFAGDLAYGNGIGLSDLRKLEKRTALLTDLRDRVRRLPRPETGRRELDDWLNKLGEYITGLNDLKGQFRSYRPGMDMALAMQLAVNENAAKAIGPAAKRFGFKDCARTGKWEYIAS